MPPESGPDEVRELLGAYALNALDPDERARVDRFLLSDASARAELHELEHAAAWLGHASLRPPARAWDAIAADVRDDLEGRLRTMPEPRPARSRRSRWLVAAAVAVLALGAGGIIAVANRTEPSRDTVAERAREAARDDSARSVTLQSADGRWSARVVMLPDRTGYLGDASMPPTEPGHDLQVWSITPEGPVSAGVIHGRGKWHEVTVADGITGLAVTEEPRGGSRAPTSAPIVSGQVRA